MPVRIQRKRSKGWRAPLGAVDVTRGGKFGNPFVVTEKFKPGTKVGGFYVAVPSVEDAVECFRSFLQEYPDLVVIARHELRGKDLMCWCPLDQPCHADVLLELANAPADSLVHKIPVTTTL